MSLWESFENYQNARHDLQNELVKLILEVWKLLIDYKWARIVAGVIIGLLIWNHYASQPDKINLYDAVMSDIKAELGVSPEKIVWTDVIYPFNSESYKKFKAETEKNGKTPEIVEKRFSENLKLLTVRPTEANSWLMKEHSVTIIGLYKEKEIKIMIRYGGEVDIKYIGNSRTETKSYEMR